MKNVKLTLATTLSILALSFAGAASADNGSRFDYKKQKVSVSHSNSKQSVNKNTHKNAKQNKKIVTKVVVKKAPAKKAVVAKKIVKQPSKVKYVSNNRYTKKVSKPRVYLVRSGDTLYNISYKTGVSVSKLAKLNRIKQRNLNNLYIGQTLRLI